MRLYKWCFPPIARSILESGFHGSSGVGKPRGSVRAGTFLNDNAAAWGVLVGAHYGWACISVEMPEHIAAKWHDPKPANAPIDTRLVGELLESQGIPTKNRNYYVADAVLNRYSDSLRLEHPGWPSAALEHCYFVPELEPVPAP